MPNPIPAPPPADAAAGVPSLRRLGTSATSAAAGNDTRLATPSNASATPTAAKIPIAGVGPTIAAGWIPITNNLVINGSSIDIAGSPTLAIADAVTNTTSVGIVQRHTTSGTAAAGFGTLNAVDLQSAAGNVRRVSTDATSLVTATDGAEEAVREFKVMGSGTLASTFSAGFIAGFPSLKFGAPASNIGFYRSGNTIVFFNGATNAFQFQPSGMLSQTPHIFSSRLLQGQGVSVASANTITLGTDGNVFPISGTTTINGIATSGWQAGSCVTLILPASITVTHNSGAPGGGAVAILLRNGVSLTTTAVYVLNLVYDGANWQQPGASINIFKPQAGSNLTDANTSISPGNDQCSEYVLPPATLTTNRTLTIATTGTPKTGLLVRIVRRDFTSNTYALVNGGTNGGTIFTFAASGGNIEAVTVQYNGVDWVYVGFEYLQVA